MVGDGMNDAPALAAANVGISMGISGSAVAMETSHITLMSNDILKIPKAIRLAKRTHCKIMANILFSVITKIAILALAIAGHPLLWAAVLADVGTCLIVILNSMMLLQTKTLKARKRCCRSMHTSHVHKHKHSDHCSTGVCSSVKPDSCWEESHQSEDCVRCCEESGIHAESTNHKHEVATGFQMGHHGQYVHDGSETECHSDHHGHDAHFHCGEECNGHATHAEQQLTHVDCCIGSGEENHGQDAHVHCREEHHNAYVQCGTDHNQDAHAQCSEGHHDAHDQCHAEHHGNATGCQQPDCVDCYANDTCRSNIPAETTSHQHVVFIESEGAHCSEGVHEKHCHNSYRTHASKHCHSHIDKKENGCCRAEQKASKKIACCSTVPGRPETREIRVCQKTEKMCEKRGCCSSYAQYGLGRREVGGCCHSYRRAFDKNKVCCAGGIAHLPEIVIE